MTQNPDQVMHPLTMVSSRAIYRKQQLYCKCLERPKVSSSVQFHTIVNTVIANPNRYFPGLSDLNITRLSEMCQNLYFPTEQQTPASTIVTITGIWKLLGNFEVAELQQLGFDRAKIQQAKNLCESSLDRASRSLPIFLEQSYIQVQALMLLVRYLTKYSGSS